KEGAGFAGTRAADAVGGIGEENRGNSSAGRASAFQAECHGFESRFPLQRTTKGNAHIAQSAEHFLGKEEVTSSILVVGSRSGSRSAGAGFADAWAVDEVGGKGEPD